MINNSTYSEKHFRLIRLARYAVIDRQSIDQEECNTRQRFYTHNTRSSQHKTKINHNSF